MGVCLGDPPSPNFGGGAIGGDCVVSANNTTTPSSSQAKKLPPKVQDHLYDSDLRFGLRKEIRSQRFTVGIAASLNQFSFNLLVRGPRARLLLTDCKTIQYVSSERLTCLLHLTVKLPSPTMSRLSKRSSSSSKLPRFRNKGL